MSFEIIKAYKEHYPALRLIGKRYTNADRGADGGYGDKWNEWFQNGWFKELEKSGADEVDNGYLGFMTIDCHDHSIFEYWIGVFLPADTTVPAGYNYLDLPESDIGMTWVYGDDRNGEIFGSEPHTASYNKLKENGLANLNINAGGKNKFAFFERYNCPRYTIRDEKGNVILDYGFYLG